MKIDIIKVHDLDEVEWKINNRIEELTEDNYEIINVQYMNQQDNGGDDGITHYIMIIYK